MKRLLSLTFAILLLAPLGAAQAAPPEFDVPVVRSNVTKLNLAIAPTIEQQPTLATDPPVKELATQLNALLGKILEFSGNFKLIDPIAFVEKPEESGLLTSEIDFDNWRVIKTDYLIKGAVKAGKDGGLLWELRLYDAVQGWFMAGKRYSAPPDRWRLVAQKFANEVLDAITGSPGFFDTRLAYEVRESRKRKFLEVRDFDGGNVTEIVRGDGLNLRPSWSPDGWKVAYISFRNKVPGLYVHDLKTGKEQALPMPADTQPIGATFGPGGFLAVSSSRKGNSDIHIYNPALTRRQPLVSSWAQDFDPNFSPDGRWVLFVSDRTGTPQIYKIRSDGEGLRRLTTQGQYNTSPVWSPKNDVIAYTRMEKGGETNIYLMNLDGEPLGAPLTWGLGRNENPTWSPDGRFLAFSSDREGSGGRVYVMRIFKDQYGYYGGEVRALTEAGKWASNPSWSPRRE